MHLRSLKIFCDIVRLGSFSKAAELNAMSQPSVSQLVQQLEDRLGVRLLDRSKRPLVVTPAGQLYHDGCREVVDRYEELEQAVREASATPGGRLRVAAIYSVGLGQMHQVVEEFRAEFPGVELRVEYAQPEQVRAAVLSGEADLGVTSFPESDRQLAVTRWRDEPFAVAAAVGHPLATRGAATVDDLRDESFVMPRAGLRVRDEVDRWLVAHGVRPRVSAEFDNLESVKRSVEVGDGVGLLPAPTFVAETIAGTLRRIDLVEEAGNREAFVRPLGVLHRRQDGLSDTAEHFLRLLQRHADDPPEALLAGLGAGLRGGDAPPDQASR
ncbi:MAG: LysR family transcriptional regulator [Planctomycetota bacterium]